ncbi:MAG: hypothetical protein HY908_34555, partial [Myxococcales bacterium]|nr:hypothetical protein [Myxococcales bacterium]
CAAPSASTSPTPNAPPTASASAARRAEPAVGARPGVHGSGHGKATVVEAAARAAWRAILAALAHDKPAVASVFGHAAPLAVEPARIVLGFEAGSFLLAQAEDRDACLRLRAAARAHFGLPADAAAPEPRIEIDKTGRHRGVETVAGIVSAEQAARIEAARKRVSEHPLVVAAISELGATLRDIRLPDTAAHA